MKKIKFKSTLVNQKTIKNILKVLIIGGSSAYILYTIIFSCLNDITPKYQDCGTVISKSSDEIAIKYGIQTELYLNCQLKKQGFTSVEVTPSTYFSTKKGDAVCFSFNQTTSNWYFVNMLIGRIITILGSIILGIYLIIKLIDYTFDLGILCQYVD